MKSMQPFPVGTRVGSSKLKGRFGNSTRRKERVRRLHMTKQEDLGREKQRRPLDDERRTDGWDERDGGNESGVVCHELMSVLKRGNLLWKCG